MKKKIALKKNKKGQSSLAHQTPLSVTLGQKAADKITKWAGSWTFILSFTIILILWMFVNTSWILFKKIWDPFPFILLNLVLSCLAAFQAPIILMSQNRTTERDRQRSEYDYAVNRKAEREIQTIKKMVDRIDRKLNK
jgi:uncharacterized membrane protein